MRLRIRHRCKGWSGSFSLAGALAGSLVLATAGCGGHEHAATAVVERTDSAGVEIVVTHRPAWPEGGGWRVDSAPELSIGKVAGQAPYLFADVRGAVRLDDGSIVAADGQSRQVRFFDSTGKFVRAVGGPGGGPEEFPSSLYNVARCGADRLYAWDRYADRILEWNTRGRFVRSFQLIEPNRATPRGPYNADCTDDGGFVAIGWGDIQAAPKPPPGGGALMYTQMAPVWVLDSVGGLKAALGSFLSSERILVRSRSGGWGSGPHPFGRATKFAAAAGRIYIGTGEGIAVSVYDPGGHLVRIERALTEDLAIDPAMIARYRSARLRTGGDSADRRALEQADFKMPPELPGYTAMRATPDGHLWIKRFAIPGSTSNRWGVFAPDGTFLGNLELPAGLTVSEIGNEYVLGVAADSMGVQRVELHRIQRSGAG